ncbi:hypothetical protein [Paenibacillus sp. WLX2291]|uniref:hypothetical protein n=1 Tax=Paenibacillus sp. WLX2291 TaxID=3296934 RepID=UPI0039841AE4
MFVMTLNDVREEMNKINSFLSRCLWMDFELCQMNAWQVVLSGSIDPSIDEYAIDIEFEEPYFISSLFLWHADTSKVFIELANEAEIIEMNKKYNVEQGNYIFKINTEEANISPLIIIAKKISVKILNEDPFLKA